MTHIIENLLIFYCYGLVLSVLYLPVLKKFQFAARMQRPLKSLTRTKTTSVTLLEHNSGWFGTLNFPSAYNFRNKIIESWYCLKWSNVGDILHRSYWFKIVAARTMLTVFKKFSMIFRKNLRTLKAFTNPNTTSATLLEKEQNYSGKFGLQLIHCQHF